MKKTVLIIVVLAIHFICFGQQKEDKNQEVSDKLVGSWKLDYALYSRRDSSKIFHTDTIHFYKDHTFKFRSHDTEFTDVRTHTGSWEVTKKGKVLNHRKRQANPPFDGPSPDLTFPIQIINDDRIRIDYIVHDPQGGAKSIAHSTPVFFERIE